MTAGRSVSNVRRLQAETLTTGEFGLVSNSGSSETLSYFLLSA